MLDYVQDPTTWVFAITERIGVFILQQLLLPLHAVPRRGAVVHDRRRLTAIAFVVSGVRPALTTLAMLFADRVRSASGRSRWTRSSQVLVATALAVAHRSRSRGRSPPRATPFSKAMRPVNDVLQTLAAARLHHPVRLPDAGLDRARDRGGCALCLPGHVCASSSGACGTSHRTSVEAASAFGASRGRCSEGQAPARGRRRDARRQPGDHHGARASW